MSAMRIAVIPGDGIGQEVVPEGVARPRRRRPQACFAYEHFPWGCQYYLETGRMMAADGARAPARTSTRSTSARSAGPACRTTSACGACAWRSARASTSTPTSARCACCPACRARCAMPPPRRWTGWWCARTPRASTPASAAATWPVADPGKAVAIQAGLFTEEGCERIMRYAFDLALTRRDAR